MARITKLCITKEYSKYFKDIQRLGKFDLFTRFDDIENVIKIKIDQKYQHFISQPIVEGDSIIWYCKPYIETPQRLSALQGEEYKKYDNIKNESIAHYKKVINSLHQKGKKSEAECLGNTIKFINDDFIFCFDGCTVLGVWGMRLKENVREPIGTAVKYLFPPKPQPQPEQPLQPVPSKLEGETPVLPPINPYMIRFLPGEGGVLNGTPELLKHTGEFITENDIPKIEPKKGFEFNGWDRDPINHIVTSDTEFTAQYKPIITPLPWYKRFWNWIRGLFIGIRKGCLKWLLWLLLLLLLLTLIWLLFRSCYRGGVTSPIPYPITDKPWIHNDPRVGHGGGIYDPGNPYEPLPTPPKYGDILPPNQGILPPIDTSKIIRDPDNPLIISNRLNVLMENEDKSIMNLAKDFKVKYPDDKYKVVYYDDVVKRMQIEVPPEERIKLKLEIPSKFKPEYNLFVFDEALFESNYMPNDPAFADPNKSWFLKAINALKAWDILLGSPKLTIAIIDDGFSLKHPELQSKVVMPYNVWLHSEEIFPQKIDHGTHVAGLALAIANNGKGLCGVAPECAFMPVQVADKQNIMTITSVLDGIIYALYQGADVINVSLGIQFKGKLSDNEQLDLQDNHFKEEERLWNEIMKISNKHKAIIVVAAGNENMLAGVNPMNRPKNFIVVSAVDKSNREYHKAGFSNYGDYSTISAPGVDIYSTVGNDSYQFMDGTSMAAPIVSGTVALIKSLNEAITSEQIICVLQSTGLPTERKIGNLIQIDKALQKVKSGKFTDCDSLSKKPSTGDVQVLLSWNNYNDLDLACTDPDGNMVWYKNKQVPSGGRLEIDMNVHPNESKTPIENIYWPKGGAPNGTYEVYLWLFKQHETLINETPFKIIVKYGDKTEEFTGVIKKEDGRIHICTFVLGNNDNLRNPNAPNPPFSDRTHEDLLRERERLQKQIDEIDRELQNIRRNMNYKK